MVTIINIFFVNLLTLFFDCDILGKQSYRREIGRCREGDAKCLAAKFFYPFAVTMVTSLASQPFSGERRCMFRGDDHNPHTEPLIATPVLLR